MSLFNNLLNVFVILQKSLQLFVVSPYRRWRGSIYKLVWRDFAVFAVLYYGLNFAYLFALNEYGRR